jgi:CMP-2-keto-3-deoxyoctulosonic acid synthetase
MDVAKLNDNMPAFLDIHQVIIALQSDEPHITLEWVRYSFDLLCDKYAVMRRHLAGSASIVHNPTFEN